MTILEKIGDAPRYLPHYYVSTVLLYHRETHVGRSSIAVATSEVVALGLIACRRCFSTKRTEVDQKDGGRREHQGEIKNCTMGSEGARENSAMVAPTARGESLFFAHVLIPVCG